MNETGLNRINWARNNMGVIAEIRKRFVEEKPFKGIKIGMAQHVDQISAIVYHYIRLKVENLVEIFIILVLIHPLSCIYLHSEVFLQGGYNIII